VPSAVACEIWKTLLKRSLTNLHGPQKRGRTPSTPRNRCYRVGAAPVKACCSSLQFSHGNHMDLHILLVTTSNVVRLLQHAFACTGVLTRDSRQHGQSPYCASLHLDILSLLHPKSPDYGAKSADTNTGYTLQQITTTGWNGSHQGGCTEPRRRRSTVPDFPPSSESN